MVASSVKRDRPPKEPLKAIKLPDDVEAFIKDFNKAIKSKDIANIAISFSDQFLNDGINKQKYMQFLSMILSYVSESKTGLTKFEPDGDIAKIEMLIKDKYFEIPSTSGSMLIKENGQWKWYGNQIP